MTSVTKLLQNAFSLVVKIKYLMMHVDLSYFKWNLKQDFIYTFSYFISGDVFLLVHLFKKSLIVFVVVLLFALSCHKSIHSIDCVQCTQLIPVYSFSFFRNSYLSQSTPLSRPIFFCIFSSLFPCSAYFSNSFSFSVYFL